MSVIIERPASSLDWLNRREYPFSSHDIAVEGGKMHFVDEGQGEPFLFLHGWPTWSYLWRHAIRDLRADHRCVAPDLIGFGLSEKPQDFRHSPAAHCRNLALLIQHLDLQDITLVAHDFGGPIGLAYAVDNPDRIRRVVLMNTWCWNAESDEAISRLGKRFGGMLGKFMMTNMNLPSKNLHGQFADRSKFTESLLNAYGTPLRQKEDRVGAWALASHLLESGTWYDYVWNQRHELDGKPMLFLWGMKDPVFGERCLNRFWHEFPLAEVERFSDAGHCLPEEKPIEVLHSLRHFVEQPANVGFMA